MTRHTGLTRTVVNLQPFGVKIFRANLAAIIKQPVGFRAAKVPRQRAAAFEGIREDIANTLVQALDLQERQAVGGTLG